MEPCFRHRGLVPEHLGCMQSISLLSRCKGIGIVKMSQHSSLWKEHDVQTLNHTCILCWLSCVTKSCVGRVRSESACISCILELCLYSKKKIVMSAKMRFLSLSVI